MLDGLSTIKVIICDVDGVMTDGRVWHDASGEALKPTHARDGYQIKAGRAAGLIVGVCSGRAAPALRTRLQELRCEPILLGIADKVAAMHDWLVGQGLDWSQVAFIGDDLPDAQCLARAGVGVAVADAAPALRQQADLVLHRQGGAAAVAECIERVLRAQGRWRWQHEPGVHG